MTIYALDNYGNTMKTADYIKAIKSRHNVQSDYAVAKLLGITPQKMSDITTGRRMPGNLMCFKIAELVGDQPAAVIADIELERAEKGQKEDDAEEWEGWVTKLKGAALGMAVAVGLSAAPVPSPAAPAQAAGGVVCILC